MKDNAIVNDKYYMVVKREKIKIDGKDMEVFSYYTSLFYNDYNRTGKIDFEDGSECIIAEEINNINEDIDYYYSVCNTTNKVDESMLDKCDDLYDGAYFTIENGKLELINDKHLLDKINGIELFDIKEVYKKVLEVIKGQDEHVKSILASIMWNQRLNESNQSKENIAKNKHNILMMGNTGVGKTEIIRQISANTNIPMVVVDATEYTESGYVGKNIEDMLIQLYRKSDKRINKAESGILVIDEFDKLAKRDDRSSVNKEGVQQALLTLIEGATKNFKLDGKDITFNTHGLTIILLGAFSKLEQEMGRMIGFNDKGFRERKDTQSTDLSKKILDYGIEPEIIGRINKIRRLNNLNKANLISILKSNKGRLMSTINLLKNSGVNIKIDEDYLEEIADLAIMDSKGARSLNRIINEIIDNEFNDIMFGDTKEVVIKKKRK